MTEEAPIFCQEFGCVYGFGHDGKHYEGTVSEALNVLRESELGKVAHLRAEVARLQADYDKAVALLRPFAELWLPHRAESPSFQQWADEDAEYDLSTDHGFTWGQVRNAASFLAKQEKGDGIVAESDRDGVR